MEQENKIIVFQEKHIRRAWHNEEWWFAVSDVVETLTDTKNVRQYIKKMRSRDTELNRNWGTICTPLQMMAKDGKKRKVNAANTEGIFRIIQSIPSPKAEPFKQWLAKVGYERIQEIENPELAAERARQYYRDLGYDEKWIETRLQAIAIRGQLTDEWKSRGVKEGLEYSILTAEISRATFGLIPSEYMQLKGLKRENLRDHMTNLELIFTMLGEEQTRQEAIKRDAQGFPENKEAAVEGGTAAGNALEAAEPGFFSLCLEAGDDLCSNVSCVDVEVTGLRCETTYALALGAEGETEKGTALLPAQDGGFYLGGSAGPDALITKFGEHDSLLWQKRFSIGQDQEEITHLLEDGSHLAGIVTVDGAWSYCFRYNMETHQQGDIFFTHSPLVQKKVSSCGTPSISFGFSQTPCRCPPPAR